MMSKPSIYRGEVKRGKEFQRLPLNPSRRSFIKHLWPFDEFSEVAWPMSCCHVLVVDWGEPMNEFDKRKGSGVWEKSGLGCGKFGGKFGYRLLVCYELSGFCFKTLDNWHNWSPSLLPPKCSVKQVSKIAE
ncbi:hypothetical protein Tco_1081395 [Tanacetum coccineum]|uniref:Uncharacterized protein n=1 Tax=Tanacetum coccineum TaxID=301880 RepID=A0ABQ5HYY2_9ASTR